MDATHAQDHISIHALREEGDMMFAGVPPYGIPISIHALREEGDTPKPDDFCNRGISIHALREEGDGYKIHD